MMDWAVYKLVEDETGRSDWVLWDAPLNREDANDLKAQREQETGETFKVDVDDGDWGRGY